MIVTGTPPDPSAVCTFAVAGDPMRLTLNPRIVILWGGEEGGRGRKAPGRLRRLALRRRGRRALAERIETIPNLGSQSLIFLPTLAESLLFKFLLEMFGDFTDRMLFYLEGLAIQITLRENLD